MRFLKQLYLRIYRYITRREGDEGALDKRSVHVHLMATLSTSILMWSYTLCAIFTIDSPIPGIVGAVCSTIHLGSPLLFRFTNNLFVVTMVMLCAGFVHQGVYAFFTGGFSSHILIWYGIIPMLAGIIEGYRSTLITSICVISIALAMLIMELSGFPFPDLISPTGRMISQALLVFGWIALSSILMFQYLKLTRSYEVKLKNEKDKTQALLQILLHDISNHTQAIQLTAANLRYAEDAQSRERYHDLIEKNLKILGGMIQSVKRMHVIELEKKRMRFSKVSLRNSVANSLFALDDTIKRKKISIKTGKLDYAILGDAQVLENQVLGNIISNSVKFSPENGEIEIYSQPSPTGDCVNLFIKDYGIGIPANILQNLFNPKAETSRPGTNAEKGTGLGMIIAKSMIDKMGGQLDVTSSTEEGHSGTCFSVSLRRA